MKEKDAIFTGHIVIVDNNSEIVPPLTLLLENNNFTATILPHNKTNIEHIIDLAPDVIIISQISVCDDICKELNTGVKTHPIPLLFINTVDNEAEKKRAFDLGCTDYLPSSIQNVETIARIKTQVKFSQTQRQLENIKSQLQDQKNQLIATSKELESFSYSISHDLRAPLRSIAGFSAIICEDYNHLLDDEGKNYLSKIENGVFRIRNLIDDMLRLSKISRKSITREQINLSGIAQKISSKIANDNPERTINFKISPNLSTYCDEELLDILLTNLFDNAQKFTTKTQLSEIEFGSKTQDGNEVFFIKDNGIGFDMGYADKLFQPFQKLNQSDEYDGTGIGLAAVQRVINMHGGRIWAESELEKETTFYFVLM